MYRFSPLRHRGSLVVLGALALWLLSPLGLGARLLAVSPRGALGDFAGCDAGAAFRPADCGTFRASPHAAFGLHLSSPGLRPFRHGIDDPWPADASAGAFGMTLSAS